MKNETKHTPTPWAVDTMADGTPYLQSSRGTICSFGPFDEDRNGWVSKSADMENAQFIAHAVNSHDALVAALESCLLRDDIADDEIGDMIRAALAQAKGTP